MGRWSRVTQVVTVGAVTWASCGAATDQPAHESCQGRPATIVGVPSSEGSPPLLGTSGDDVIVTNGAAWALAREGDDLICVTAPSRSPRFPWTLTVDAGSGDDTVVTLGDEVAAKGTVEVLADDGDDLVDASSAAWNTVVVLGTGADELRGGPAVSEVYAGDWTSDTDRDVIAGGAGPSIVVSGQPSIPNPDVVDLGAGRDILAWNGTSLASGGAVIGGGGRDTIELAPARGDWVLDNRTGHATHDAEPVLAWRSIADFNVSITAVGRGKFTFLGGPGGEDLRLHNDGSKRPGGVHTVVLGAGKDSVRSKTGAAPRSRYDGGEGTDSLMVGSPFARLSIDLAKRRLDLGSTPGTRPEAVVTAFELVHGLARDVSLRGSGRAETLRTTGCRQSARGRGGRDRLVSVEDDGRFFLGLYAYPCGERVRFHGGRGRDELRGSHSGDRLVGGRGLDSAQGRAGRDLCLVESQMSCER